MENKFYKNSKLYFLYDVGIGTLISILQYLFNQFIKKIMYFLLIFCKKSI